MKTNKKSQLLLFSIFIVGLNFAWSQRSRAPLDPPTAVKEAFENRYPDVSNARWKVTRKRIYKAYFKTDQDKSIIYFRPTGQWLKSKITIMDLPERIYTYIGDRFGYPDMKRSQRIESPRGTKYIVILDGETDHTRYMLLFDSEGGFKAEKKKELNN